MVYIVSTGWEGLMVCIVSTEWGRGIWHLLSGRGCVWWGVGLCGCDCTNGIHSP